MPFHQGHDVAVFSAADQIALPVSWDRSVFDLRWSFPDRDGLDDLALCMSTLLECCERRMRRLDRRCPMSSFFNTPRA